MGVAEHIDFNAELEQERALAVAVLVHAPFEHGDQRLAEILRHVLAGQVADIESYSVVDELATAGAVVQREQTVYPRNGVRAQPNRYTLFFGLFSQSMLPPSTGR